MADGDAERSLTEMRMARAISDEVSRRDINAVRELKTLAEIGMQSAIKQQVEQLLAEWKRHTLNPEIQRCLEQVSKLTKDYIDHHLKALDERLQAVGHFVGEWKASSLYHRGQTCLYRGSLFYCVAQTTNVTPDENGPSWQLRARGVPASAEEIPVRAVHSNGNGVAHDH